MTQMCCSTCRLRFSQSATALGECPECKRPLDALCAAGALGFRLFVDPEISYPALAAAIAAVREPQAPPRYFA
jgi:hypothetical protein